MKKSLFKNKNSTVYNDAGKNLSDEIQKAVTKIVFKYKDEYYLRDIESVLHVASLMPIDLLALGFELKTHKR